MHPLSIDKAPAFGGGVRYVVVDGCEVNEHVWQSENSLGYPSSGDTNFIFEMESLAGLKLTNSLAPSQPASPRDLYPSPRSQGCDFRHAPPCTFTLPWVLGDKA